MSEEELRKKMEFIVEQQAQFAADIQRAKEEREADAKLWREKYSGLTDAMTFVVGTLGKLAEAQTQTTARVAELAEQMRELAESGKRTDAKLAETDERLNIFINVVERYISERRNGQSGRAPGGDTDDSAPSS